MSAARRRKRSRPAAQYQPEVEKFQIYMVEMDDVLDRFVQDARRSGVVLDFSNASIERLERFLLRRLRRKLSDDELSTLKNRAARYLGETFMRVAGGVWDVCLVPRNIYFGLPVIAKFAEMPLLFSPLNAMQALLAHRTPGTLRRVVEADMMWSNALRVRPVLPTRSKSGFRTSRTPRSDT